MEAVGVPPQRHLGRREPQMCQRVLKRGVLGGVGWWWFVAVVGWWVVEEGGDMGGGCGGWYSLTN